MAKCASPQGGEKLHKNAFFPKLKKKLKNLTFPWEDESISLCLHILKLNFFVYHPLKLKHILIILFYGFIFK